MREFAAALLVLLALFLWATLATMIAPESALLGP
jgi:hypothetical protein